MVQAQLPSTMQVTDVFATSTSPPDARQAILTAINSGQLLVNYAGHGSEDEWSGDDLFDSTAATLLTNGTRSGIPHHGLPQWILPGCLRRTVGRSLMLAPNGGAVAVLASSGLNQAPPQTILDKLIVQDAMSLSHPALGDAILKAKSGISSLAVRKTYNLLGDPAMRIKLPQAHPAHYVFWAYASAMSVTTAARRSGSAIAFITFSNPAKSSDCAPSDSARSGHGCTSMINPSAPTATAARETAAIKLCLPVPCDGSAITGK